MSAKKLKLDPGIIAVIIGFIPSIFKHKPFCLWYRDDSGWILKAGPFSSRQCRKTKGALIQAGYKAENFLILRKGVTP